MALLWRRTLLSTKCFLETLATARTKGQESYHGCSQGYGWQNRLLLPCGLQSQGQCHPQGAVQFGRSSVLYLEIEGGGMSP